MKKGQASRTAEYVALFRAIESCLPAGSRLFEDRFAKHFLTSRLAWAAWLARFPGAPHLLARFIDHRWAGARSSAVARTRFIDDALRSSLDRCIAQVVILGAGFDSRAYRLPELRNLAVFEVDHPSTSARKRAVIEEVLNEVPSGVRFVTTDFNERGLENAMKASGYVEEKPTFFLWEGVTNYLTEDAIDSTLRWCARCAPGSIVLFTYVHRDVIDCPHSFPGTEKLFETLREAGETWSFGFDPTALAEFLGERGLSLEQDVGSSEYRQRYMPAVARILRGYEFYRIAVASVP